MEIGTPVWIPDDTEVWRPGEVVDRAGDGSVTVRPTEGGRRLGFAAGNSTTPAEVRATVCCLPLLCKKW